MTERTGPTDVADLLGARVANDNAITITRVTWGRRAPCTAAQIETYLNVLAETGRINQALKAAGVSRKTIYFLRADNELFALAERQAREAGADALEAIAIEQSVDGIAKGVWHQGELVGTERVIPSNPLLQFLLKAQNPARFMERSEMISRDGGKVPERITSEDDRQKLIKLLESRAAKRVEQQGVEDLL